MGSEEQRVHSRVQVLTEIDVSWAGRRVKAELRDISKGGARFVCAPFSGGVGSVLEMFLASLTGVEIGIAAEVVRIIPSDEGTQVAVRFSAVAPEMRPALIELIEVLVTTSSNPDSNAVPRLPRPQRRMEIQCQQPADLRDVLRDIAGGQISMAVEEPMALHEPLEIAVPDLLGNPMLMLRGAVISQISVVEDGAPFYEVQLEFPDMRPEARGCLEALMAHLAESR